MGGKIACHYFSGPPDAELPDFLLATFADISVLQCPDLLKHTVRPSVTHKCRLTWSNNAYGSRRHAACQHAEVL